MLLLLLAADKDVQGVAVAVGLFCCAAHDAGTEEVVEGWGGGVGVGVELGFVEALVLCELAVEEFFEVLVREVGGWLMLQGWRFHNGYCWLD